MVSQLRGNLARLDASSHRPSRHCLPADIVQDLYLREIKAYKPTPIKPTDADEHVQKFVAPKAPESPEEANLANDLKAYEQQVVEVEGQSGSEGEEAVSSALPEWMEDEPEEDEEKHAAH
ncbi:MAG: hypothetical protein M1825_002251 [Sarcosagium campestre]|nr:MAG: hypothetical protein M1825_002251 [Sarcosagium campestre]